MAKPENLKKLFEHSRKHDPFSIFETEFGFLRLSDDQKALIRYMTFTPGSHIFAHISGPDGIQCVELPSDHPKAFEKFVDEHERTSLAYAYLGVADEEGKVY
jgi:hypothetical protein